MLKILDEFIFTIVCHSGFDEDFIGGALLDGQ